MMAQFVCRVYQPKGINITQIPELRWHLFCKTMAESEKLPPTLGTLKQHVNRSMYRPGYGDKLLLHNKYRFPQWAMGIMRTIMVVCVHIYQMCHQHPPQLLRWSDASARLIAKHSAVHASTTLYHVQTSADVVLTVRMMRIRMLKIVFWRMTAILIKTFHNCHVI